MEFEGRIITCKPRQRVKTWRLLERAMLLEFRAMYGEVPAANTHGKRIREQHEFKVLARSRVRKILDDLA